MLKWTTNSESRDRQSVICQISTDIIALSFLYFLQILYKYLLISNRINWAIKNYIRYLVKKYFFNKKNKKRFKWKKKKNYFATNILRGSCWLHESCLIEYLRAFTYNLVCGFVSLYLPSIQFKPLLASRYFNIISSFLVRSSMLGAWIQKTLVYVFRSDSLALSPSTLTEVSSFFCFFSQTHVQLLSLALYHFYSPFLRRSRTKASSKSTGPNGSLLCEYPRRDT